MVEVAAVRIPHHVHLRWFPEALVCKQETQYSKISHYPENLSIFRRLAILSFKINTDIKKAEMGMSK